MVLRHSTVIFRYFRYHFASKFSTSIGSLKKQESSKKKKNSTSVLLTMPKPLTGSQQTVENSERDGSTRPPDLPPEKSVHSSRNNGQNWTWNNRLVSNQERSMSRLHIVTLIYMQSTSNLFNLYAEYIKQNARLDEAEAGINIAQQKYQ